jgi:hypothetical protein
MIVAFLGPLMGLVDPPRGVSADSVHGYGRVILHISQTGPFAALNAYSGATSPDESAAYATREARPLRPRTSARAFAPDDMAVGLSRPPQ